ncbi:MAG: hypothetical protein K8R23_09955 [Chthoniobacter sp.]|nr:hypothetical protein [Chthoniobacter sp.]
MAWITPKERIQDALAARYPHGELKALLLRLRDEGHSADALRDLLDEFIRREVLALSERAYLALHEMRKRVTGNCPPEKRIFPEGGTPAG